MDSTISTDPSAQTSVAEDFNLDQSGFEAAVTNAVEARRRRRTMWKRSRAGPRAKEAERRARIEEASGPKCFL